MWIFLGSSGCSLVQKSPMATLFLSSMKFTSKAITQMETRFFWRNRIKASSDAGPELAGRAAMRRWKARRPWSPPWKGGRGNWDKRAMSLTGYPSTRECPARYLMMPCQSLPDTRHRSRQIRRPAAQSKLRSSAQDCSACFVSRAHYEMQTNRDFTLTRWSLIRVCPWRRNTKKPRSKTPRLRDPNRIQTYNLLIRSQMLYSVELWDHTRY